VLVRGTIALKTLVLGLGHPIRTDDGVGIYVVRAAGARCGRNDVAFAEASAGGLQLLDFMAGYERLILVDAIQTRAGRPGDVYRLLSGDGAIAQSLLIRSTRSPSAERMSTINGVFPSACVAQARQGS
jgi:hydrogenase maturation protease